MPPVDKISLKTFWETVELRLAACSAAQLRAICANKNSHHFRGRLRNFLLESVGFGPFIFRLPDRSEIARAHNMWELEQTLAKLPAESLYYHAADHHFSI
jgi:hypothetical protein